MSDLFLIAHKVRSAPAFDIATRLPCPLCQAYESVTGAWCEPERQQADCDECDQLGFWWIISTSGHRAYPWHYWPWDELACDSRICTYEFDPIPIQFGQMPEGLVDHYIATAEPHPAGDPSAPSLAERLGLTKARAPTTPLVRRL